MNPKGVISCAAVSRLQARVDKHIETLFISLANSNISRLSITTYTSAGQRWDHSLRCLSISARMAWRVAPVLASVAVCRPCDLGRCRLLLGLTTCDAQKGGVISVVTTYQHIPAVFTGCVSQEDCQSTKSKSVGHPRTQC